MILDDLAAALFNLFLAFAAALIEAMIHLGALVFGAGYMATRHTGLIRLGFGLLSLGALYLLFGILRWLLPALSTPALWPLYSGWAFIAVLLVMLVGLFLTVTGAEYDGAQAAANTAPRWLVHLFSYGLATLAVLVLVSGGTTTAHQRSLAQRACDAAHARLDTDLSGQITKGLALADLLLDEDITRLVPCRNDTAGN